MPLTWQARSAIRSKGGKVMWSDPLISITVYIALYAIGTIISDKTKGLIGEALFLCFVYAIGFATGIIPRDSLESTGIPTVLSTFGIVLVVTNLGTMIELRRFIREWRTVAVCCGALAVMTIVCGVLGTIIYNKYYAFSAIPPLAGGVVAQQLVSEAARNAGMAEYGAFAALVCSFQTFVGIPLSAYLLRKHCDPIVANQAYQTDEDKKGSRFPNLRIFKPLPESWNDGSVMVTKLLLVALLGSFLSSLTGIPSAVVVLLLGILFAELGFLDRQALTKAGYMNFLFMGLIMLLPLDFSTLTIESLGNMLVPMVVMILLGAVGLMIGGSLVGLLLKIDWKLSSAISLSAFLGYPLTESVVRTVVRSFKLSGEEEGKLMDMVLPQMIIAGFTTVTFVSVLMAGVIAPMIFK